jgi:hypothetical protein
VYRHIPVSDIGIPISPVSVLPPQGGAHRLRMRARLAGGVLSARVMEFRRCS